MDIKSAVLLLLVGLATSYAQPAEGPCCFPDQFVVGYGSETAVGGRGGTNRLAVVGQAAIDANKNMIGNEFLLFQSDEERPSRQRLIQDYEQGFQYIIDTDELKCSKTKLQGDIPHCVPPGVDFNTTVYLGDRQLFIDSYHYQIQQLFKNGRSSVSVTKEGCIPNSASFSGTTFRTSILSLTGYFNYEAGIADPDRFFEVPEYCPTYIEKEPKLLELLKYSQVLF